MFQKLKRVFAMAMIAMGLAFGLSACTPAEEEDSATQEQQTPQIDMGGAEE